MVRVDGFARNPDHEAHAVAVVRIAGQVVTRLRRRARAAAFPETEADRRSPGAIRLCSRYSRVVSTCGSMMCVVSVGDFGVDFDADETADLTEPNRLVFSYRRKARARAACDYAAKTLERRARCSATSCLRPKA